MRTLLQENPDEDQQVGKTGQRVRDALGEGWNTLEVLVMEPSRVAAELEAEQGMPAEAAAVSVKPAPATPGVQHGGRPCLQLAASA